MKAKSGAPNGGSVVLYELNEVPWLVLDRYVADNPTSAFSRLLSEGRCETTVNEESDLQPWRSWPTVHTGLPSHEHCALRLGEDPSVFRGERIWETAEQAGLKIGVFGALQSWPPHEPRHGGFYVPDAFSQTADTFPRRLMRFQRFNLALTKENAFSSATPLRLRDVTGAGLDMLVNGLTPASMGQLAAHLVRERRDPRYRAGRSMFQVIPSFDLYWRLHRRTRPDLSIFFTNHVAGMMHRFWGDLFEDYPGTYDYSRDPIHSRFITEAMDMVDKQLHRIMQWVTGKADRALVVAASMGQGPIPYRHIGETLVLRDISKFCSYLKLPPCAPGVAMHPLYALTFADQQSAQQASDVLRFVTVQGIQPFRLVERHGASVTFALVYNDDQGTAQMLIDRVRAAAPGDGGNTVELDQLGIAVEERLGGGNTAYHTPYGPFITFGRNVTPNGERTEFPAVDARDRILSLLGVKAKVSRLGQVE